MVGVSYLGERRETLDEEGWGDGRSGADRDEVGHFKAGWVGMNE